MSSESDSSTELAMEMMRIYDELKQQRSKGIILYFVTED